jgi:hypothetical protein
MKKLLPFLLPFTFLSVPVLPVQPANAQYALCPQYQESYQPGGYDRNGNYIQGQIVVQKYAVPCGMTVSSGGYGYGYYQQQGNCNPVAGAAMGAGLAEALSGGNGYRYNSNYSRDRYSGSYNYSYRNYKSNGWSLFGAGLGALMYSC